jgi:hypothetical protein
MQERRCRTYKWLPWAGSGEQGGWSGEEEEAGSRERGVRRKKDAEREGG